MILEPRGVHLQKYSQVMWCLDDDGEPYDPLAEDTHYDIARYGEGGVASYYRGDDGKLHPTWDRLLNVTPRDLMKARKVKL